MSVARLNKTTFFQKMGVPCETIRIELKLFRAVLDKALLDLFDEEEEYRLDAKNWLDKDNPDFIEICDLAFLEPELVYLGFLFVKKIFKEKGEDQYIDEDELFSFHRDLVLIEKHE
jgi:hypothetical protein